VATIILQGMAARIGLVAQRGLVDVVRGELGNPWMRKAIISMVLGAILIGNAAYQAGNIGGATLGLEQLLPIEPLKPYYPLLLGGLIFVLLWFSTYKVLEKVFVALVATMGLGFVICAVLVRPAVMDIFKGMFIPRLPQNSLLTIIALVGTPVVPYNLLLRTALGPEKWKSLDNLSAVPWDSLLSIGLGGIVPLSSFVTAAVAPITDVHHVLDMAKGLEPPFG